MDIVAEEMANALSRGYSEDFHVHRIRPIWKRLTPNHNVNRLFNRFVTYPNALASRAGKYDLFHIIDHSYAHLVHSLPGLRTVVTCHDTDAFRCLFNPSAEPRPFWFRQMSRRILTGLQKAAHVICVSNATRQQLLHHNLVRAERCTVVHNGVHEAFGPEVDRQADQNVDDRLKAGLSDVPFILHVGSTVRRKRIDVLLQVFSRLKSTNANLLLVRVGGRLREEQRQLAADLGVAGSIVEAPFLAESEQASLYRRSALVLQTSDSEGFGLPVAEAMACGAPVLASDIDVLREIGGTACEYAPVGDVEKWSERALLILNADQSVRSGRRAACIRQAKPYRWGVTSQETVRIYRQVLGSKLGKAVHA